MVSELKKAISAIEKEMEDYCSEHSYTEPDTGSSVFENDYCESFWQGLFQALELVKAIDPQPKLPSDEEIAEWMRRYTNRFPSHEDVEMISDALEHFFARVGE